MSQSATPVLRFPVPAALPLEASFDGGRVTSDGGLPWLDQAEVLLGICAAFAACVPDWRRGPVRHRLEALVRQRVFQIACGYEDQDDADTLRSDPLLKLVCGQLPESGRDLASQPTFSRLENAVDRKSCYRLAVALGELYLRQREREDVPTRIILDVDGTDDPTHGQQEGSAYHGYYRQHMLHPLLIFDGETHQLITAVLRPGNTHGSPGVKVVLKRVVRAIRARGDGENAIKDFKVACFADRLSDHRFCANQFRLLLHAAAYWLLDTLRRWLSQSRVPRMQLDTLRLRLLKIGGRVYQWRDRIRLRLAASHPGQPLWDDLAAYRRLRE